MLKVLNSMIVYYDTMITAESIFLNSISFVIRLRDYFVILTFRIDTFYLFFLLTEK